MKSSHARADDLIAAIYDAAIEPHRWDDALNAIIAGYDATNASIILSSPTHSRILNASNAIEVQVEAYNAHYAPLDPLPAAALASPANSAMRISDVYSRTARARMEIFADWAIPNEMGEAIFAPIERSGTELVWFCLAGPIGRRTFLAGRRAEAERLCAHVARAGRISRRLSRLETRRGMTATRLRNSFGLTPAETRIALAVAQGGGLAEAALKNGVARSTASTHLQRVFDKCGVHTQAALAALIATQRDDS